MNIIILFITILIFFTVLIIAIFGISYAVIVLPLEYTTDSLRDSYDDIATKRGWDDATTTKDLIGMNVYYFAAAVVIGVGLFFVWFIAYAQKKEYEKY